MTLIVRSIVMEDIYSNDIHPKLEKSLTKFSRIIK